MKIKKPSLKGSKNCGYLGHFAQDKYLCEGHNTSGKMSLKAESSGDYSDAPMASEHYYEKKAAQKRLEEDRADYAAKRAHSKELDAYSEEANRRMLIRKRIKDMMD